MLIFQNVCPSERRGSEESGSGSWIKMGLAAAAFGYVGYRVFQSSNIWATAKDVKDSQRRSDIHFNEEGNKFRQELSTKAFEVAVKVKKLKSQVESFNKQVNVMTNNATALARIKLDIDETNTQLEGLFTEYKTYSNKKDSNIELQLRNMKTELERISKNISENFEKLEYNINAIRENVRREAERSRTQTNILFNQIESGINGSSADLFSIRRTLQNGKATSMLNVIRGARNQLMQENNILSTTLEKQSIPSLLPSKTNPLLLYKAEVL